MSKKIVCFLLTVVMLLGMIPMTAINANAASNWSTSTTLINSVLTKPDRFEEKAYQINGVWYIGYGSEIANEDLYPDGITADKALELLKDDLEVIDDTINDYTKSRNLDLTQQQHDALVMFCIDVGESWMSNTAFTTAIRDGKKGQAFLNAIAHTYTGAVANNDAFRVQMNRLFAIANLYLNADYAYRCPSNYTYVVLENGLVSPEVLAYISTDNMTLGVNTVKVKDENTFLGWYLHEKDSKNNDVYTCITKLDSSVSRKTLTARYNGDTDIRYTINSNTLATRYVFTNSAPYPGTPPYSATEYGTYMSDEALKIMDKAKQILKKNVKFNVYTEQVVDGVKWLYGGGTCTDGKYKEGWVYLGELPEADKTTDKVYATATLKADLKIYEGATAKVDTGVTISKGTTVNIYETKVEKTETGNKTWGKVNYKDTIGWINLAHADVTEVTGTNNSAVGRTGTVVNTGALGYLRVREAAGTDEAEIATLPEGTKVTVLETKTIKDAVGNTAQWGYVEWSGLRNGHTKGWVHMYYINVKGLEQTGSSSAETVKYTGVVTSNINLNVRTSADVYAAKNGPSLPNGTKINIYEITTKNNVKWGRIGEDKWVCLQYVNYTAVSGTNSGTGTSTTTSLQATVSISNLAIYKNYNSNAEKIGTLKKGDVLTVLERNTETTETGSRIWGRIIKNGVEGWVNLAYVDLKTVTTANGTTSGTTSGTVSSANGASGVVSNCIAVNIRTAAGTGNAQITKLNNGTAVKVYDRVTKDSAPWARITWNDNGTTREGWVCMNYVTMAAAGTDLNTNGSTVTGTNSNIISATGTVNSNINLKVRSGAGLEYPAFESLAKGTKVTVYEQVTNNGMIWGRINTASGSGWICMSYVTVDNVSFTGKGVMGTIARCAVAVNVRSAPGTGNALVGTIGVGKRVEVFETRQHGNGMWARVAQGWISMDYVLMDSELAPGTALDATKPTTAPTQATTPAPTINKDNEVLYTITGTVNNGGKDLIVHNDTSDDSDKIGTVKDGVPLTILAVKSNNAQLWGRIDQYATAGWVNMDKVIYGVHGYVNTEEQAVYANADTSSTVKGTLAVNTELNITKLNADGETVYGWVDETDPSGKVPAGLNGWIPMGRISKNPVEVIPVYKSSLDQFTYGFMVNMAGTTNAAISAYDRTNGTEVVFKMTRGVTVYVDQINLEYGRVWGKVLANNVEGWIDMASVTYVIQNCSALKDMKVYKTRDLAEDENLLDTLTSGSTLNLCELSFDGNGMLWAKIANNGIAELNGGYVRFTDELISAAITVQYK